MNKKSPRQNKVPKTMLKFTSPAESLLLTPELFLSFHLHLSFLLILPWTSFLNIQKTSHYIHLNTFLSNLFASSSYYLLPCPLERALLLNFGCIFLGDSFHLLHYVLKLLLSDFSQRSQAFLLQDCLTPVAKDDFFHLLHDLLLQKHCLLLVALTVFSWIFLQSPTRQLMSLTSLLLLE